VEHEFIALLQMAQGDAHVRAAGGDGRLNLLL
jgi:hypothetical protein